MKGVVAYRDLQHAVRHLVNHYRSISGKNTKRIPVLGTSGLCCRRRRSSARPLGLVHSDATRKLRQALACWTARSWTTRSCGWLSVGPLGQWSWSLTARRRSSAGPLGQWSWSLTARRRSSAGPLGLSALREQPACAGDRRQTPTASDTCPMGYRSCGRCFGWLFLLFVCFTLSHWSLVVRSVSSDSGVASSELDGSPRPPASPRRPSVQPQRPTTA